jgi:hypothetical protein
VTVQEFVSDVELQLLQGAPSDDSELEHAQIKAWGSYNLNQLVANELNEKIKRGEQIPAVYQVRAALEIPELEEIDGVDESDERIFVEMDNDILTLNKDMGVIVVTDEEGGEIKKADIQTLQIFKHMRFGKPTLENPLYYRQGRKIFLLGFKPVDIPFSLIEVFYVPKQNLADMADTDEILCSDLVLPQVIAATVQTGKLQLYGTQQDTSNDGVDVKGVQYHTAIQRPE